MDKKKTLLHVLMGWAKQKEPDLLLLDADVVHSSEASQWSLNDLKNQVQTPMSFALSHPLGYYENSFPKKNSAYSNVVDLQRLNGQFDDEKYMKNEAGVPDKCVHRRRFRTVESGAILYSWLNEYLVLVLTARFGSVGGLHDSPTYSYTAWDAMAFLHLVFISL